jgi:hypothetical protein
MNYDKYNYTQDYGLTEQQYDALFFMRDASNERARFYIRYKRGMKSCVIYFTTITDDYVTFDRSKESTGVKLIRAGWGDVIVFEYYSPNMDNWIKLKEITLNSEFLPKLKERITFEVKPAVDYIKEKYAEGDNGSVLLDYKICIAFEFVKINETYMRDEMMTILSYLQIRIK